MKDASQTYDVKIARGCLVLIGIAVLLWAVGTSSAQESQGISKLPLWRFIPCFRHLQFLAKTPGWLSVSLVRCSSQIKLRKTGSDEFPQQRPRRILSRI